MRCVFFSGFLSVLVWNFAVDASTIPFHESDAWFCQDCSDVNTARQHASRYLAPLKCTTNGTDDSGRPTQSCGAPSRRIVLIQPDTRQIYSFVGRYEFTNNGRGRMQPIVYDTSLNAADTEGYQILAEYFYDVKQTFKLLSDSSSSQGVQPNLVGVAAAPAPQSSTAECPSETALHYYLDSKKMDQLKMSVSMASLVQGHPLHRHIQYAPRLSATSAGVTVGPFTYSANLEKSQAPVRYVHEFAQSEVPNAVMNDRLVFDVTMSGFDSRNWPVLGFTLRLSDSKIANSFGGEGLNTQTDNACVIKLLNKLAAEGTIQLRSGGRDISDIGHSTTPIIGGGLGGRGTCMIEIYQWGKLQARFIVPKTRSKC